MVPDPAARRRLLDEYFALNAALEQSPPADLGAALSRRAELRAAYEAGLPIVPLSRCPFTQDLYAPPFDSLGLGGPYWDYHTPVRPLHEAPATLLAVTGAMRLGPENEPAPFLANPGPAAPFVYPRLLRDTGIQAVVYAFPLQLNAAFVIAYFGLERPPYLAMPNLWGAGRYEWDGEGDERIWYESPETDDARDYELRPWVQSGAVHWIMPADPSMTLRSGVEGCPYLEMPGERDDQFLFQGVRT